MAVFSQQELEAGLNGSEWSRDGETIVREWQLEDFAASISFVNRVADLAEEADHHPDIELHDWNRVRLRLSTHSEGGVTAADLDMAGRIDALD